MAVTRTTPNVSRNTTARTPSRQAAKPEPETTGLEFIRMGSDFKATNSEGDTYTVAKLDNGNWATTFKAKGSRKTEVVLPSVKGVQKAYDAANSHNEGADDDTPEPVTASRSTPAAKVTTPPARAKKVPAFPEFEEWAKDVNNVPAKKRGQNATDYANLVKGKKLKWGQERAKYNRENGLEASTPTKPAVASKVTTPRKPAAPKPEPLTRVERLERLSTMPDGGLWNDFGDPDPLAYELSRVNNSRASVAYGIEHGKYHPAAEIAANSYFKAVERAYSSEVRFAGKVETGLIAEPKGFEYQYFGSTLSELPEDEQSALSGYVSYYEAFPDKANPEAKIIVKGKVTGINPELLTLYPVIAAPKKNARRK